MQEELYIWAPVIVGRLDKPRLLKRELFYQVEEEGSTIEDLKLKIRQCDARIYGINVEILIKTDILCLMEDRKGKIELKAWQESISDQIFLKALDGAENKEGEVDARIRIIKVSIQGEMRDKRLYVQIYLEYTVFATSYQEIKIMHDAGETCDIKVEEKLVKSLAEKMDKIAEENYHLKQKLFLYEQDIKSLKQGIKKAENRNLQLKEELSQYKKMVERGGIKGQDRTAAFYKNQTAAQIELGRRIKRMFNGG